MNMQQLLAVVMTVGMVAWQFWPSIAPIVGKIKLPKFGGGVTSSGNSNPSYAEVAAALSLISRYQANCNADPEYPLVIAALHTLKTSEAA